LEDISIKNKECDEKAGNGWSHEAAQSRYQHAVSIVVWMGEVDILRQKRFAARADQSFGLHLE
jgi:hypothetical protein